MDCGTRHDPGYAAACAQRRREAEESGEAGGDEMGEREKRDRPTAGGESAAAWADLIASDDAIQETREALVFQALTRQGTAAAELAVRWAADCRERMRAVTPKHGAVTSITPAMLLTGDKWSRRAAGGRGSGGVARRRTGVASRRIRALSGGIRVLHSVRCCFRARTLTRTLYPDSSRSTRGRAAPRRFTPGT